MTFAFRVGPVPIRIHAWTCAGALALGVFSSRTPRALATWLASLAAALLVHEIGRGIVSRVVGISAQIDLLPLRRVTRWSRFHSVRMWRRIAIDLAGPLAGVAFGAALLGALRLASAPSQTLASLTVQLALASIAWGALNVLPILPLDGGHLLLDVLDRVTCGCGERPARIVSAVLANFVAILAFAVDRRGIVLFAFVFYNVLALRAGAGRAGELALEPLLREGLAAVDASDAKTALRNSDIVLASTPSPELRREALRVRAIACLSSGAWGPLMNILESEDADALGRAELAKFERAARELGRPEEARRIARRWS